MAQRLGNPMWRFLKTRSLLRLSLQHGKQSQVAFSSKKSEDYVVMTDDGSTIVCWHPEPAFPYECSRPLPEVTPEPISVLKVPYQTGVASVMKRKADEAVRQELMKITHTTKHRWFPRSRDRYYKHLPQDREYL